MSHRSDTLPVPSGQTRSQVLRDQSIYTQLLEVTRHLQQTMREHFVQLMSRQGLLQERRHTQAIHEQEALLSRLLCQMINLLQSGATSGLELQALPSEDSRDDVRYGQGTQLSGQPDPVPQLSDCEAAFVSRDLSNRGTDISALYWSSFQDYNAYQKDKYHKDKNTLRCPLQVIWEDVLKAQSTSYVVMADEASRTSLAYLSSRSICQQLQESDMNCVEEALLQYPDWRGQPFLREEVARFLTYYCKAPAPLDPENVSQLPSLAATLVEGYILGGCSALLGGTRRASGDSQGHSSMKASVSRLRMCPVPVLLRGMEKAWLPLLTIGFDFCLSCVVFRWLF
ncbi:hypothetical protein P7K49_021899 [Saguinus oedipus]|uniref:Uncharacterized protein n=1 Tax=Saguinus oedipus TaxID=9490 RepID=A0ABQ9UUQ1_SAGOE|nr:hypothetical protein P7K49_021899 [Saguinus oedipus]